MFEVRWKEWIMLQTLQPAVKMEQVFPVKAKMLPKLGKNLVTINFH